MTPEEKAEKLVDKMYYSRRYDNTENYIPDKAWEHAKQCAVIAVDEIINSNPNNPLFSDKKTENGYTDMTPIDYWQEVKKEIENL
jgi:hypothetical protein